MKILWLSKKDTARKPFEVGNWQEEPADGVRFVHDVIFKNCTDSNLSFKNVLFVLVEAINI